MIKLQYKSKSKTYIATSDAVFIQSKTATSHVCHVLICHIQPNNFKNDKNFLNLSET